MRGNIGKVLCCLAAAASVAGLWAQEEIHWVKWVAPDRSFSLQQPAGWKVTSGASDIHMGNLVRAEEVEIIHVQRAAGKTPTDYMNIMAGSFRQSLGKFDLSRIRTAPDAVAFLATYTSDGRTYSGPGAVVFRGDVAWWLNYGSGSAADFDRGSAIVSDIARSVADGAGPVPTQAASGGTSAAAGVVGKWSTTGYFGDLVNANTGAFVQASYSGEWYAFRADGTYQYTISTSGTMMTGVVMDKGTYEVRGTTLVLHQQTESYFPMANDRSRIAAYRDQPKPTAITLILDRRGPDEMRMREAGNPASIGTFHRAPEGK